MLGSMRGVTPERIAVVHGAPISGGVRGSKHVSYGSGVVLGFKEKQLSWLPSLARCKSQLCATVSEACVRFQH